MHPLRYILEPFLLVSLFIVQNNFKLLSKLRKTILLVFLIVVLSTCLAFTKGRFSKSKTYKRAPYKASFRCFSKPCFSKTQTNVLFL